MPDNNPADARPSIDAALVKRLIAAQFPQWSELPIKAVEPGGWDNRTFRLGERMIVRLPSAASYALQVEKEQHWLPRLAPQLPVPIPTPVAKGQPDSHFPWAWSVYDWLDGETMRDAPIGDLTAFATDVAAFLSALQKIDSTGGPLPGQHNFFRGAAPGVYDSETRQALAALRGKLDTVTATEVWETALASTWEKPPVWFHGDIAWGNLLLRDGRLCAVIDFGTSGIGDPACDLVIAWALFDGESRKAFRNGLQLDEATWARGRGWALWKALITVAGIDANQVEAEKSRRVIEAVLADHKASQTA